MYEGTMWESKNHIRRDHYVTIVKKPIEWLDVYLTIPKLADIRAVEEGEILVVSARNKHMLKLWRRYPDGLREVYVPAHCVELHPIQDTDK